MAEYIERKETVSEMLEAMCGTGYQQWAIDVINRQPAADVVPVVRCKECKDYNRPRLGYCSMTLCYVHPNDYCSYGERRK